jgi:predicted AlkP superfamily phosphohydrolase/phosphomutase
VAKNRVLIIGLDGATWDVLLPWIEEGKLPVLGELVRTGASFPLLSTRPPYTPQAWSTLATGANPGKHGILGFEVSEKSDPFERRLLCSRDLALPPFWRVVNGRGISTGLLNVPMTYPPGQVEGFMVTGMMTPSVKADFTYPPDLGSELLSRLPEYIVDVKVGDQDQVSLGIVRELAQALSQRARACEFLLDRYPVDVFYVVFETLDRINHVFWKHIDRESPLYCTKRAGRIRKAVVELYQEVDRVVGSLWEALRGNALTILISDHGFGPHRGIFYVNGWLVNQGMLQLTRSRVGLAKRTLLGRLNVDFLKRRIPRWLLQRAQSSTTRLLDLSESVAWSAPPAMQGIFVQGGDDSDVAQEIGRRLQALVDPHTGQQFFPDVWRRREVYRGPYAEMAPDLILPGLDVGLDFSESITGEHGVLLRPDNPRGNHRREGIMIVHGSGVRAEGFVRTRSAHLADVMPTLLNYLDVPIPDYVDGSILDLFESGVVSPPRFQAYAQSQMGRAEEPSHITDQKVVEERLHDLGYV